MKQVMRSTFLQILFNPYDQDVHINLYIDNGTVYDQLSHITSKIRPPPWLKLTCRSMFILNMDDLSPWSSMSQCGHHTEGWCYAMPSDLFCILQEDCSC